MIKFYQDNVKTFLRVPLTPPTCFTTYQPQVYLNYISCSKHYTHKISISLLFFKASNVMLILAAAAAAAADDDDDDNDDSNALLINSF